MEDINSEDRFSRLELLLGQEGLERLENSSVMVIGLGGVGSSCAEALARGGIGKLILLDRDVVEASNINRQALAFTSTIGRAKVDVMEEMIQEINPACKILKKQVFLRKENIGPILSSFPRPDYVLDCIDTVSQKLAIIKWCMEEKIPLLASMGAANKMDPAFLEFSYIEKTKYCPLSKVMRRECKKRGIKKYEVLYTSELPKKIADKEEDRQLGTMSYMPPIMGQMLAGKVIRRLAGLEKYYLRPRQGKREEE